MINQEVHPSSFDARTLLPQAVWGREPMTLTEIYRPEINLAILERELSTDVQRYAEFVCALPEKVAFVHTVSMDGVKPELRQCLPCQQHLEAFIQDVENAATVMGMLFSVDNVGLRLQTLDAASCPEFHNDKVPCRLLLTYRGRGTQWLDENNLDRSWLGARSDAANEDRICLDESRINEIGSGHIAIFKGEGWEGNEGRGLVHRSPPHSGGTRRLVLTIDLGQP